MLVFESLTMRGVFFFVFLGVFLVGLPIVACMVLHWLAFFFPWVGLHKMVGF
jgi:hypothetical protein